MTARAVAKTPKGEIIPPKQASEKEQLSRFNVLNKLVRNEAKLLTKSITNLGGWLSEIKRDKLYRFEYSRYEEYVSSIIGERARSTLYEMIDAHSLTEGENAVGADIVDQLGTKKAAQLARLEPQDRTPEIIKTALRSTGAKVKEIVQEKINEHLPPEERREALIAFMRNYPSSVIDKFEALEERGIWLQGIRDGDRTIELRAKFMYAMCCWFEQNFAAELKEADHYRERQSENDSTKKASEADEAEPEGEMPPDPEDFEERPTVH